MYGNYSSIAAHVTKLIIVWPWENLAAEAAHEPYTCIRIVRRVVGAWGGRDGVGGGRVQLGGVK